MERIDPIYAYDAPTYSVAIVGVSSLTVVFSEVDDPQPSMTTTIGFFTRDPIGYRGGLLLYRFVSNRSLSRKDPFDRYEGDGDAIPPVLSMDGGFIECEDFLQMLQDNPPGITFPEWNRSPNIFCSDDCKGMTGLSWWHSDLPGSKRTCNVCLKSGVRYYSLEWLALLAHEFEHCSSDYFCTDKTTNSGPPTFNPVPIPNLPVGGDNCGSCKTKERRAYRRQCEILFPEPRDRDASSGYARCINRGICGSCALACKNDKDFKKDYGCEDY